MTLLVDVTWQLQDAINVLSFFFRMNRGSFHKLLRSSFYCQHPKLGGDRTIPVGNGCNDNAEDVAQGYCQIQPDG